MKLPFFKSAKGYSDGKPPNTIGTLLIIFHLAVLVGGGVIIWMQLKSSSLPLFTADKILLFLAGVMLIFIAFLKLLKLGGTFGGFLVGIAFGWLLYGVLYSIFNNYMIQELKLPIMVLPEPYKMLLITTLLLLLLLVPSRFDPFTKKI